MLGILLVALGGAGVLRFKPETQAKEVVAHANAAAVNTLATDATTDEADGSPIEPIAKAATGISWIALFFVAVTALCWGTYGPLLHRGQAAMSGSRLRPFICVGLSYFVVAIVFPAMLLLKSDEPFTFPVAGTLWSLAAGTMGALGR